MKGAIKYPDIEVTGTYPHPIVFEDDVRTENMVLKHELAIMRGKLADLEKRLPLEKIIVIRDISRQQAKEEIRNLFKGGKTYYYSDIVQKLKLDLETVVEICNELQASGEIEEDASIR